MVRGLPAVRFSTFASLMLLIAGALGGNGLIVNSARGQCCGPCCGGGNPPPGGGGGGGGNTIAGGRGGAGVVVDASGLLRMQMYPDATGQLMRTRVQQARATLASDIAKPSPLRKVSLNRLEKALAAQLAEGRQPSEDIKYLAGLTDIQYVFCYPETGDVVLAGPAEGWVANLSGRMVGLQFGRPVLELQDLVAAMRTYVPGRKNGPVVGCSIDPTEEGLQKMQQFLRQLGGQATPDDTQFIVQGLRTNLGLQKVRIMGVSPDTHFAQVLVEADYRMKLIAIGLEPPQAKITTFIDKATPSIARNALIRWYFVPNYQCVRTAEDGLGMELVGDGVKLVDENEAVLADGKRVVAAGSKNGASMAFTTTFTQKYPEIAQRKPIYAQLRNLVDMSIAAAFIQKQDYYGRTNWKAELLLDESRFPIQNYRAPLQVDTVVTSVWKGNQLLTPVAGGVTIQAHQALTAENLLRDEQGKAAKARQDISLKDLKPNQWWWD
jgi:hypothetical protein